MIDWPPIWSEVCGYHLGSLLQKPNHRNPSMNLEIGLLTSPRFSKTFKSGSINRFKTYGPNFLRDYALLPRVWSNIEQRLQSYSQREKSRLFKTELK